VSGSDHHVLTLTEYRDPHSQVSRGDTLFLIADTGYGKTLCFVLAAFLDPKKIVVIISPLNALETSQVHFISSAWL
jgi:superfamily II DNA helicase RecQ